jgi:hypothetical protein
MATMAALFLDITPLISGRSGFVILSIFSSKTILIVLKPSAANERENTIGRIFIPGSLPVDIMYAETGPKKVINK